MGKLGAADMQRELSPRSFTSRRRFLRSASAATAALAPLTSPRNRVRHRETVV